MAFSYREITVSGNTSGIEGTSRLIQEIKNTLVNNMGWTLTEDRSTQPGTSHIVVLQSTGEQNNAPVNYYLILTSGTGSSAAVGQDAINVRAGSAWSTTTHSIPSSGTGVPTTSGTVTINTDSNGLFNVWISGDKDAVTFITKVSTSYDGTHFGRINQFTNSSLDKLPLYVVGSNTTNVDTIAGASSAYTFIGTTATAEASEADWDGFFNNPLGTDQHPNNVLGSTEAYVAMPLVAGISDTSPVLRSVRGFSINIWSTLGPSNNPGQITIDPEDELAASDGKVYKVFYDAVTSSQAVVIRKS